MTKQNSTQNSGNLTLVTSRAERLLVLVCLVVGAVAAAGCVSSPASGDTSHVEVIPAPSATVSTPVLPSAAPTPNLTIPVRRIIVTNSNAAELLIAIGAKDEIVGVSETVKTHPVLGPEFAGVDSIGSWQAPDVEKILSLHPDAVVSYASYLPKNIDKITASNITILPIDCYKIDTLASDTRKLGNITGHEQGAEDYIEFLRKYETLAESRTGNISGNSRPRVYFESYSDYTTLTGGTGADTLLSMAGGRNIAGLLPASSPKVNAEWVYAENPDVIVKVVAATQSNLTFPDALAKIQARDGIRNVSAVQNGRVYVMSNDIVYGPRAVIGLLYLSRALHPEQFSEVNPHAVLDEYAQRFVTGTNTTAYMYPLMVIAGFEE
ncbi:MAG: ABC transporter substrate-binding protein [Methanoregula sp.]